MEKRVPRAVGAAAHRTKEAIMAGLGIQAWSFSLIGIHTAFAHRALIETLEFLRSLGSWYRLACSEARSSRAR